jgi:ribonucleoside-diphosphate reductase beta chain
MSIFDKRIAFKPFEYPEAVGYKEAISHSYWLVSEWNFIGDVHDFKVKFGNAEREVVRRTLLAISQVEVSVKKFWANVGDHLPKPEFDQVGAVFAESEVRHADAYSHLLQVLGLNGDFDAVLDVPAIRRRVDVLERALALPVNQSAHHAVNGDDEYEFVMKLTLFSLLVENVSLFSQFAIIKSFNQNYNALKDVDNVVQATMREEQIHALFGAYLVRLAIAEHPAWYGPEFERKVHEACQDSFWAEVAILDWIFEQGELPGLPKVALIEMIKSRFNQGLKLIGLAEAFYVDTELLEPLAWFEQEMMADTSTDFFHKKSTTYSKKVQAFRAEDLF